MSVESILLTIPREAFRSNAENFEPKLSFDERCAILALYQTGISIQMLAAAFQINRRTVRHIVNPEGKKYKTVRDTAIGMGATEFRAKYLTEDMAAKVRDAVQFKSSEIEQPSDEYDASPHKRASGANIRATKDAGISMHKAEAWEFAHRIEVQWLDANTANGGIEHPAGWYCRDLDADPEFWEGDYDTHTHFTSSSALAWFKREH